jgi:tetratricopeptide (TPR) repeat protein
MHLRQYALAKNDYETLLKIVPINMEARLGLAMADEKLGRRTDAMDQYNQLVQMFPDSAVCYASRAAFETSVNQYETALYDWSQAITLQPKNVDYIVTKTELLLQLEQREAALKELENAVQRGVPFGLLRDWFDKCRAKRH